MSQISKSIMAFVVFGLACTSVFANDLVGDWKNPDSKGGLTRIVVSKGASDNTWTIQAWGACSPTDCDWGRIDLQMLRDDVDGATSKCGFAHWDHKFKDMFVTVRIREGILVVETYDLFKDGSGRANYSSTAKFERQKTDLAGDWQNPDPKGGLTRIVVSKGGSDNAWKIQAWALCSPADCDWGEVDLQVLGDATNDVRAKYGLAHWDQKFADKFITLRIEKGGLVVETYDLFKDGSGRANYRSTAKLERQKAEAQ